MAYIIYSRFSPRRNAEECDSCETQERICAAHAERKGGRVRAMYRDEAASGADADRPGLEAALSALNAGDVLLVYKRDRIARDVLIAELTRRRVLAVGASVEAVAGDVDGDEGDPTVRFVRQIMDAVAELERKQISQRTRDAMRQHMKDGRPMSRFAPYGQALRDGAWVENPEEQKAIRRIAELVGQGMKCPTIVATLNVEMPKLARAGKWNTKTVYKLMDK